MNVRKGDLFSGAQSATKVLDRVMVAEKKEEGMTRSAEDAPAVVGGGGAKRPLSLAAAGSAPSVGGRGSRLRWKMRAKGGRVGRARNPDRSCS